MLSRAVLRPAAIGLAAVLFGAFPANASLALAGVQQQDQPAQYDQALALLASGDTAAALELLRAVTRSERSFGPGFLRLGAVLAAQASWMERDFGDRVEAERAFRRALRFMGPDPELLLEWGVLLTKQHIRIDALRTMENALRQASRQEAEFSPALVSRMHYAMARVYEVWWEDGQNMRLASTGAPRECWSGAAPTAASCADVPNVHVFIADRGRMKRHYRAAMELDAGNVDAGIRLLGHLADQEDWEEYEALADRLVAAAPLDARALLFRGLGLHHVGRTDLAESFFERALILMPPTERGAYERIDDLLHPRTRRAYLASDEAGRRDVERIFFTVTDPMYLTDVEERRMEHYGRTAWADLKFSSPTSGVSGWDTDRGLIYRRYGQPDIVRQERDRPPPPRTRADFERNPIEWGIFIEILYVNMFRDLENRAHGFYFQRNETYRLAWLAPASRQQAENLEVLRPEYYRPRTITDVAEFPHQVVRFRGTSPGLVRFEIYGVPPVRFLGVGAGDSLVTGLFLHDFAYHPAGQHRRDIAGLEDAVPGLGYRIEKPAGTYFYSLEARAKAPDSVPRPLARSRSVLTAELYPPDRVSISDVLLADSILANVAAVSRRDELTIMPSHTMVRPPGRPLNIYFEVYGLAADDLGYGRFRVELLVADSAGPGLMTRILRGAQRIVRTTPEFDTRQRWERIVAIPRGDDRIPEYLTLDMPPLESGTYRVEINVTDLLNQTTATTTRYFLVDPAPRLRGPAQPGIIGYEALLHRVITGERL